MLPGGSGVFNLATGAFTRTGVAANQLAIYGIETVAMAVMRAAPAVTSPASKR